MKKIVSRELLERVLLSDFVASFHRFEGGGKRVGR